MSEPKKTPSGASIIKWCFLCLFIGVLIAVAIPNSVEPRHHYAENACVNNMLRIEAAKQSWVLLNRKTNGDIVTENDIKPFLKPVLGGEFQECPAGGKYSIGKVLKKASLLSLYASDMTKRSL